MFLTRENIWDFGGPDKTSWNVALVVTLILILLVYFFWDVLTGKGKSSVE